MLDPAMFSMQGTIILTILVSSFNVKGDSGLIEVQDRIQELKGLFALCLTECNNLNRGDDSSCVSNCGIKRLEIEMAYYDGNYEWKMMEQWNYLNKKQWNIWWKTYLWRIVGITKCFKFLFHVNILVRITCYCIPKSYCFRCVLIL